MLVCVWSAFTHPKSPIRITQITFEKSDEHFELIVNFVDVNLMYVPVLPKRKFALFIFSYPIVIDEKLVNE